MLTFVTDESGTDAGWTMEYDGAYADVKEQEWQEQVTLTPNPVQDRAELTVSDALWMQLQPYPVQICDISGKVLKTLPLNGSTISIDMSSYAAGVYFLKIGAITKKLLKQ